MKTEGILKEKNPVYDKAKIVEMTRFISANIVICCYHIKSFNPIGNLAF